MHISWSFLDKQSATINALEAYTSMEFIIRNTDDEIQTVRDRMSGVRGGNMDGLPHAHNPQAAEERMIDGIEEIDTLKERYRQAVEYMNWFKPAWEHLSEDELYVLEAFYMTKADSAAENVAEYLGIDRKTAYVKKHRATKHLSILLYGKY